ncbi:MAG: GAF domain-containing protein [Anaerolineae bacterium]|nr:GAF domain-containing protein [Anaerolineae bacterium]
MNRENSPQHIKPAVQDNAQGILKWLFSPLPSLSGEEQHQQARLSSTLFLVISILLSIGLVVSTIWPEPGGYELPYVFAVATLCMLVAYGLSRTRYYSASLLALLTLSIFPFGELAAYRRFENAVTILMWLILPLILSTVLLKLRDQILLALIDVAGILILTFIGPQSIQRQLLLVSALLLSAFSLLAVLYKYRRRLELEREFALINTNQELQAVRASLEAQVAERTRSAEEARAEAEAANQALETQMWQTIGQAALTKVIRDVQTIPDLSADIVRKVCQYADIAVGALFLTEGETLRLVGSYAYPFITDPSPRYQIGSGLVGEAAHDKQTMSLRDIPENYLPVTSGLGEIAPAQILAVPCLYQNQVVGVLELASLVPFSNMQIQFITTAAEMIASACYSTRNQTQQQANDLQREKEELLLARADLTRREDTLLRKEQAFQAQQQRQTGPGTGETSPEPREDGEVTND